MTSTVLQFYIYIYINWLLKLLVIHLKVGSGDNARRPPRLAPLQGAGCQCDRWKCCKAAVKWLHALLEPSPRVPKLYQKRPSLGGVQGYLISPESNLWKFWRGGEGKKKKAP